MSLGCIFNDFFVKAKDPTKGNFQIGETGVRVSSYSMREAI